MQALYFMQYAAVAAAGACAALLAPRWLGLPAGARLAAGACCAPLVLAFLTLAVAWIAPGAPPIAFLVVPCVLAAAVLVAARRAPGAAWRRLLRFVRGVPKAPLYSFVLWGYAAVVFVLVCRIAAGNAAGALIGHDALVYFSEARAFAQARALDAIPGFFGAPDALLAAHPHTFVFQAYIAQALLAAGSGVPGYPDDGAAKLAVQLLVPMMLLAMAALGARTRLPGAAACALLFPLLVPQFEYLSSAFSRDAFRIIPIILAVATLPVTRAPFGLPALVRRHAFCAAMMGWTLAAHTLNATVLAAMAAAVAVLLALRWIRLRAALVLAALSLAALALPLAHYFRSWWDTGHILGYGMYYRFYPGTPLADAHRQTAHWSGETGFVESLTLLGDAFGGVPTHLTLAIALGVLVLGAGRAARSGQRLLALMFVAILVLPVSGLLDIGSESMRGALLSNLRYPLHVYALAGAVVALAIGWLPGRTAKLPAAAYWTLVAAATALAATLGHQAHKTVDEKWRRNGESDLRVQRELYLGLRASVASGVGPGENWVTDLASTRYYVERRPIHLYTLEGSKLFAAGSEEEVWKLLRAWNVRMVVFYNRSPNWWPKTVLHAALQRPGAVELETTGQLLIYRIRRSAPEAAPAGPPAAAPAESRSPRRRP